MKVPSGPPSPNFPNTPVAQGGMPQVFPDFTRGDWKTTAPLGIVQ